MKSKSWPTNITSRQEYEKAQEAHGVKVGDIVTVTHVVPSEVAYWDNVWVPKMDIFVNKLCVVIYQEGLVSNGIQLRLLDPADSIGDEYEDYGFPYFVVRKI